jgi:hypothetical protein
MRVAVRCALILATAGAPGCLPNRLDPAAADLRMISYAPRGCQQLGPVEGDQGGWISGDMTSKKDLELGARNALRNQAHELGANVVQLVDRSSSADSFAGSGSPRAVRYGGIAWRCPASAAANTLPARAR